MNCVICKHGETNPGFVTVMLQRGETTVILKQVPGDVCNHCGEYYLSSEVSAQAMEKAEAEILRFAA